MRTVSCLALAFLVIFTPAVAQQAKVKQDPAAAVNPDKMTIGECLSALAGLQALDGYQVVVNQGKPNEQVVVRAYEFGNGKLRGDIAANITVLTAIQKLTQETQQKIFAEVAKGDTEIKPGSAKNVEYDKQLREHLARPCNAQLVKIKDSDLKLDKNEISVSSLSAMSKIREP